MNRNTVPAQIIFSLTALFILVFSAEVFSQGKKSTDLEREVDAFISRDDIKGAAKLIEREIKKGSNLTTALYLRAQLRFYFPGLASEALADIDRLIELEPGKSEYLHRRARMKLSLKDVDGALTDIEEAISLEPNSVEYGLFRSRICEMKADMTGAEDDLRFALSEDENDPFYANYLSDFS